MGLIDRVVGTVFGSGANVVVDTVGAFRENAENAAVRDASLRENALSEFAAEFQHRDRGAFDRFMDGMNRVPRPAMALGTLGLFVAAMVDPVWFGARMEGMALVPEPLWWLLGAIVSFYFGARHQSKGQEFRRELAESAVMAARRKSPRDPSAPTGPERGFAVPASDAEPGRGGGDNPALDAWRQGADGQ